MASAIDATKPVAGSPTTQSVRDNFATAASEITALQTAPNQTITLSGDIAGSGTAAITATLPSVNANVGAFQGLTVNAKGQVTAAVNQSYAPLASPALTGSPTVNGAAFAAGHLPGTATNDAAAAGQVGEVVSAIQSAGIALANGATVTIATISLTPGDWDVSAEFGNFSGTGTTFFAGGISTVAATMPAGVPGLGVSEISLAFAGQGNLYLPLAPCRASLNATTSYYLVAQQAGGTGMQVNGKIWARRAR